MDIVTHILAAREDECAALAESLRPLDAWSGIDAPGLDTLKIALWHALLTGDALHTALDLYEPVYVAENETVVLRLADELLERMAQLDEAGLEILAGELAASEAFENESWHEETVQDLLFAVADLAQLAQTQGQVLFVWMFPVRD